MFLKQDDMSLCKERNVAVVKNGNYSKSDMFLKARRYVLLVLQRQCNLVGNILAHEGPQNTLSEVKHAKITRPMMHAT
jgi:hypothetical protein